METFSLIFIFGFYIGIRLLLGHHKTPSMRDRERYHQGICWVQNKEYHRALPYFEDILREHPESGIAWAYRAECHLQLGDYYQALAYSEKALNIDYRLRDCYLHRGQALLALKQYEDAFTEFDKAVWHFREKHPDTFRYRGLVRQYLGQTEKAEIDLQKAVELGDEEANYYLLRLKNPHILKK